MKSKKGLFGYRLKQIFGKRLMWVWHPESPGERVLVYRGLWGRLFKPKNFATLSEGLNLEYIEDRTMQ